jgi:putative peptidoglycan lipid II flippase
MAAFCNELEACLVDVRADGEEGATGVLPVVKPRRAPTPRRRRRWWIAALVAALALAAAAGVYELVRDSGTPAGTTDGGTSATAIPVRAVSAYDPDGDGRENDGSVPNATDGNPGTAWTTEHYRYPEGGLNKPGVGIVLDAGAPATVHQLTVVSDTPGYTAEIESGPSPGGGFTPVSGPKVAGGRTTFKLSDAHARYYVIWITNRGGAAAVHINEVTAR